MWQEGLALLREAQRVAGATAEAREAVREELGIAETAWACFESAANQVEFVMKRGKEPARCRELIESEITLACTVFDLMGRDSRIGFEATNHYYFTRLDLVEKVVNCRALLDNGHG